MRYWILVIGIALVLFRIPFFLTNHFQEDAFITWRCAINLADTGYYSYNPPYRDCATTSHGYAFLVTLVRLLFGSYFIPLVLFLNTALFVAGTYFISVILANNPRIRVPLWILVSLTPVGLLISYSGMETSLLIFVLGWVLSGFAKDRPPVHTFIAIALLPWVRPAAIGFGCILVLAFSLKQKRIQYIAAASLVTGIISLAIFNYLYFGSVLNQTIIAKEIAYHPSRAIGAIATRLWHVFVAGILFVPLRTKYLERLYPLFNIFVIVLLLYYSVKKRLDFERCLHVYCLSAFALVVPLAYVYGGVIFPWYLWPSKISAYFIVLMVYLDLANSGGTRFNWPCFGGAIVFIFALAAVQLMISFNWGTQEYLYRASVGRYIRYHSAKTDTIFLEPAGYIPFFSERRTYDEVGLGTPEITKFMRQYTEKWWIRFVQEKRPTFLIQRSHILNFRTYQGYQLNKKESRWFQENYELVKEFHYDPANYYKNEILLRILNLGSACSYYIFKLREHL